MEHRLAFRPLHGLHHPPLQGFVDALAALQARLALNEPSVVAIERDTKRILGVGLEAKRMLGQTPEGVIAVRPMKDGVIADFDVTEKMLRYFLKLIIDNHVFKAKPRVIVCVPSGIPAVEKR